MSDESQPANSANDTANETVEKEAETSVEKALPETPAAPAKQEVKVDLSELRDILDGMPEKVAQFIKEAVQKPKQVAKRTEETVEHGTEKQGSSDAGNGKPKSKGWLADLLGL